MTIRTIPACVSYYEQEHAACDGDPKGVTDAERKACDWQPGCIAFQAHLEATGKAQSDYLQILEEPVLDDQGSPVLDEVGEPILREVGRARDGGEAFFDFCSGLVRERETGSASLIQPVKKRAKQKQRQPTIRERGELRRRVRRGPYVGAARKREHMLERGEAVFAELIERLGPGRSAKDRVAPAVGQCYVLVTDISYHRLTAYCRTGKGRDQPIMRLRPRHDRTFSVLLPVSADFLTKALGVKGLAEAGEVESWSYGRYLSRIKRVDEVGMKAVIRAVVALAKKGKIDLPSVRGAE